MIQKDFSIPEQQKIRRSGGSAAKQRHLILLLSTHREERHLHLDLSTELYHTWRYVYMRAAFQDVPKGAKNEPGGGKGAKM